MCFTQEAGKTIYPEYVEDVKQDKTHVPDLLEAIMRLPGLVKEELRPTLVKIIQISSKTAKIMVSTVWIPKI